MAKSVGSTSAPVELTTKTQRSIDELRPQFEAFRDGFTGMAERAAKVAPRFMKVFAAWREETNGSFIAFVRLLDPSVPEAREDYRANSVYQAADYLRRRVAAETKPEGVVGAPKDKPVTPFQAVARLVATLMPFVPDMDIIWAAFVKELHWSEPQILRIQRLIGEVGPLAVNPPQRRAPMAQAADRSSRLQRVHATKTGTHG